VGEVLTDEPPRQWRPVGLSPCGGVRVNWETPGRYPGHADASKLRRFCCQRDARSTRLLKRSRGIVHVAASRSNSSRSPQKIADSLTGEEQQFDGVCHVLVLAVLDCLQESRHLSGRMYLLSPSRDGLSSPLLGKGHQAMFHCPREQTAQQCPNPVRCHRPADRRPSTFRFVMSA